MTFDVGNSETTIGLFDGERLHAHWRVMTDVPFEDVVLRALRDGAMIR